MEPKKAITIITFITVGIIIAIYIGDMLSCLLTDSPLSILEIVIVLVLLIGTFIATIILKKYFR
ncbi:MAG TPA: hypothetical protein VMX17_06200 [Candidatus Glassbacteria bacterium]|nr:hypothetical protein [Candidatus Glassbacteria bacterium]